jgi:hypothetical protein
MTNRLAQESSPYLLQHADNPVDWHPWGEEALNLARERNRPVLLSIGYAACHWCHVMAHESFEDPAIAELMNRHFVNIKVDREERPDLDGIYMAATTGMTGHGGWPMTVFLTPEGKPFFCGTYYPSEPRHGMPSFRQVLLGVAEAWEQRGGDVARTAETVTRHLQDSAAPAAGAAPDKTVLQAALAGLSRGFDSRHGGFGGAPKFPQPMVLEFLLREHFRTGEAEPLRLAGVTLQHMADGGIYDHLGGGFARYATDAAWLVPHFEKMLYDNAQLARVYLHAWQLGGEPRFRAVAEQTLDYVARDLRHAGGGLFSSEDADSEGEEGRFYVWQAGEIRAALGADAEPFMQVYGVSERGNWEGRNILHRARSPAAVAGESGGDPAELETLLGRAREVLFRRRAGRVRPGLDDKVLTAWNGLMLAAFAEAGRCLQRPDYLEIATANAAFLRRHLRREDGRLLRSWKEGAGGRHNAYLEDHACLCEGLIALYEASFDESWYAWAVELAELMLRHFADPGSGGFFDTSDDHEQLILRPRDLQDNAMPSGNAKAAMALFRLGLLAGNERYLQAAEQALAQVTGMLAQYPSGFGEWLNLASFVHGRPRELALVGSRAGLGPFLDVLRAGFRPNLVVAAAPERGESTVPLLADRIAIGGRATAYLCERFACQAPVSEPAELRRLLAAP